MLRALSLQVLHWSLLLVPAVGQLAAAWSVTSGQCTLEADGCISSPSYPGSYPDDDSCSIHVPTGNTDAIQVVSFDTESSDKLRVNDIDYSGTSGPDGVVPQGTIGWSSDASISRPGWKICLREMQTPSRTWPRKTSTRSSATFEWLPLSGKSDPGPSGRYYASGGQDSSGRFWIFGGRQWSGIYPKYLDDLWYFQHQVDCGQHSAVHCAVCPRDTASGEWYGESWCSGDCSWSALAGECQVEGPGAWLLEGHCNDDVNGRYDLRGHTASGSPFYKHSTASLYLYYDPDCDGNPNTTSHHGATWRVDTTAPSMSLEQDLDDDGECWSAAYVAVSTELPPQSSTWQQSCSYSWNDGPEWYDRRLTLSPVGSGGSYGGSWNEKSVTSRPPGREKQSSAMDSSDRFWIFGGWDGSNYLDDLWYFDIQAPRAPKQEVVMGCCWPANSEATAASPLRHAVPASFEPDKDDRNFAEVLEPDFQGRGEAAVYCGNVLCSPSRKKVGEA